MADGALELEPEGTLSPLRLFGSQLGIWSLINVGVPLEM